LSSLLVSSKPPSGEISTLEGFPTAALSISSNHASISESTAQNLVASRQLFSALQSSAIAKEDNKPIESIFADFNVSYLNSSQSNSLSQLDKLVPLSPIDEPTPQAWPPEYPQQFLPNLAEFPQHQTDPNIPQQPFGSVGTNSGFLAYNSSMPVNDHGTANKGFASNYTDLNNKRSNSVFSFAQGGGHTERKNPLYAILQSSSVKSDSILDPNSSDGYSPTSPSKGKEGDILLSFLRDGAKAVSNQTTPVKPLQYSGMPTQKTPSATPSNDNQKTKSLLRLLRTSAELTPSKPISSTTASATPNSTQKYEAPVEKQQENDFTVESDAVETPINATAVVQNTFRKPTFHRVTRNQVGSLNIFIRRNSTDLSQQSSDRNSNRQQDIKVLESGFSIRPGQVFSVEWAIPESVMTAAMTSRETPSKTQSKGTADMVVGLVRYGDL